MIGAYGRPRKKAGVPIGGAGSPLHGGPGGGYVCLGRPDGAFG